MQVQGRVAYERIQHYDTSKDREWKTLVFGHALCFGGEGG